MNNTIKFSIKSINNGERVDVFLSNHISYLTRSNIKKLIQSKHLLINETIMSQPTGCIEVIPVSNLSEWVIFSVENTSIPATGETDINNTECPATLEHPTSFNLVWSSIPAFHDHNSTNNIFECVDPPD